MYMCTLYIYMNTCRMCTDIKFCHVMGIIKVHLQCTCTCTSNVHVLVSGTQTFRMWESGYLRLHTCTWTWGTMEHLCRVQKYDGRKVLESIHGTRLRVFYIRYIGRHIKMRLCIHVHVYTWCSSGRCSSGWGGGGGEGDGAWPHNTSGGSLIHCCTGWPIHWNPHQWVVVRAWTKLYSVLRDEYITSNFSWQLKRIYMYMYQTLRFLYTMSLVISICTCLLHHCMYKMYMYMYIYIVYMYMYVYVCTCTYIIHVECIYS